MKALTLSVFIVAALLVLTFAAKAEVCVASYYSYESGHTTATGAHFNPMGRTAAMRRRSWFGHHVRVTYHNRSVVVLINDYGPATGLRRHPCLDLAQGAANVIGLSKDEVSFSRID